MTHEDGTECSETSAQKLSMKTEECSETSAHKMTYEDGTDGVPKRRHMKLPTQMEQCSETSEHK